MCSCASHCFLSAVGNKSDINFDIFVYGHNYQKNFILYYIMLFLGLTSLGSGQTLQ